MIANFETKLTQDDDGAWILEMSGDIDYRNFELAAVTKSQTILQRLIEAQTPKLIIDLASVGRFDCLGLQLLLLMYRQLAQCQVDLVLRNPSPHLQRILRIMQFDRLFRVETDTDYRLHAESRPSVFV
jgi:anti-anti-sigma factor